MNSSTKNDPKPIRDISYYQQRYQNRVFSKIVAFVAEQSREQQLTQKDIADRIRKDPATLSRVLRAPSNLTLDTISEILLAFDAEAEPPEIVLFQDRRPANYMHPLMSRVLNSAPSQSMMKTESANSGEKVLESPSVGLKIAMTATTGAR